MLFTSGTNTTVCAVYHHVNKVIPHSRLAKIDKWFDILVVYHVTLTENVACGGCSNLSAWMFIPKAQPNAFKTPSLYSRNTGKKLSHDISLRVLYQ